MLRLIVTLIVVTLTLAPVALGRRKGAGGRRNSDCSEWQFSDCIPNSGPCGKGTKQATRTGDSCQVKEREFKCKLPCGDSNGCKYSRQGATWTDCDATTNTRTLTLTLGEPHEGCEATATRTKPCGRRADRQRNTRDVDAVLEEDSDNGNQKGCRYEKGEWSACDEATDTVTRTLTLKRERPSMSGQCQQTMTQTKQCKKACKYSKGDWSVCDEATNRMTKTMTLRKGDTATCQQTVTKTKRCARNKEGQGRTGIAADRKQRRRNRKNKDKEMKGKDCEYDRGDWTDCVDGQRSMVRTLTAGGDGCEQTKTVTKPCEGATGGRNNRKKGRAERRNRRRERDS